MTESKSKETLQKVLEHIATDRAFRRRLEAAPIETLDAFGIQLDEETRTALEGKRFSEFVAGIEARAADTPGDRRLTPEEADLVVGGFAPPYVPVCAVRTTMLTEAWSELLVKGKVDKFRR
jgi:hypothetical protein